MTCTVSGCYIKHYARGYCSPHYTEWRKDAAPRCSVDGCEKPVVARTVCKMHYMRLRTHGDVTVVLVGGNKGQQCRESSPTWKGAQVSYSGAHMRVKAQRGEARAHTCECGRPAAHWAYDHDDPNVLTSPDGRPYSADPDHYRPMCVPCHKKLDLTVLGT